MPRNPVPGSPFDAASLSEPLNVALRILFRAYEYATDAKCSPWQFAVEIDVFRRYGVDNSEFRWLIAKGLAEHACEISIDLKGRRKFSRILGLTFPPGTCFVLSEKVASCEVLPQIVVGHTILVLNRLPSNTSRPAAPPLAPDKRIEVQKPYWDQQLRQLRFGDLIVKEFKNPARNQEIVIRAFQEEQWPKRIDDPLPPISGQDCRRRLTDTIKHLNRSHSNDVLRFRSDGTGRGILWMVLE